MTRVLRVLAVVSSLTLMVLFVLYRSQGDGGGPELSQTRNVRADSKALQHGQDPPHQPTPAAFMQKDTAPEPNGWRPENSGSHELIELDPETRKALMHSSKSGPIVVEPPAELIVPTPAPSSSPTPPQVLPSSKSIIGIIER